MVKYPFNSILKNIQSKMCMILAISLKIIKYKYKKWLYGFHVTFYLMHYGNYAKLYEFKTELIITLTNMFVL